MSDESGGFASKSVPRHLARGVVGFGALVGGLALVPAVGVVGLLGVPIGVVALRGCPMCWTMGLVQTISAGRVRRQCVDGRCELRVPGRDRDRGHDRDRAHDGHQGYENSRPTVGASQGLRP